MRPPGLLVASDLDRTLVYSAAALDLPSVGPQPSVEPEPSAGPQPSVEPELVLVERYEGRPASWMTARAVDHLRALARTGALLVPATTRTPAQHARLGLPGPPPRFAVTTNGGHLLVDGQPDPAWTAQVRRRLAGAAAPLAEVEEHLAAGAAPWLLRSRTAEGLFWYAVVERTAVPAAWLAELAAWCAPRGWATSLQGRKLYAVPAALTKSAAVAEAARRAGARRVVAGGDSLLDAELLDAADAAVRPAHGELHAAGWCRPHVAVTERAGVLGGEDVAAWYLHQALG